MLSSRNSTLAPHYDQMKSVEERLEVALDCLDFFEKAIREASIELEALKYHIREAKGYVTPY